MSKVILSRLLADSTKAMIIGYGNLDRQDDGVAWHVMADSLAMLGVSRPLDCYSDLQIETPTADFRFMLQLDPEIAQTLASYPRVCFVDACVNDLEHGFKLEKIEAQYQPSPMTHHMTPETCMAICEALYQKSPEAMLLSVSAYEFNFSNILSKQTQAHLAPAVNKLYKWVINSSPVSPVQVAEMQI